MINRSRKIFIVFCILFVLALGYASYDIASRTTFPGSKSQLKERIKRKYLDSDSLAADTIQKKASEKH
jgi:hypothetical protein